MLPGGVCLSLAPRTLGDLRLNAMSRADCVEVRLDYLENPADAHAVDWLAFGVPAIATCRGSSEGGRFAGSVDEQMSMLRTALDRGAAIIDVDYRLAHHVADLPSIASFHDFDGTPPDLDRLISDICAGPCTMGKVATLARSWEDNAQLLEACTRPWPKPVIVCGMGETGQITRVIGVSRGSQMTYASPDDARLEATASGQLRLSELLDTFNFRRIRRSTSVLGVVGSPVAHSLSPVLHNRAFRALDLDFVYVRLRTEDVSDFFKWADSIGVLGFSVTLPHKTAVLPFLQHLSPEAVATGAVNTVYRRGGDWCGDNTDVAGVRAALASADFDPAGKTVVILGTGGAARAAAAAVSGARDVIALARKPPTAWLPHVRVDSLDHVSRYPCDLLINATSVGMHPMIGISPVRGRITAEYVLDMVYTPPMTALLRSAAEQGRTIIQGTVMFRAQAARQFELWTGHVAPSEIFGDTL